MSLAAPDARTCLRQELKSWEQAFLAQHGRKPLREDIKNDQRIAEKYRAFNKSRPTQERRPQSRPITPRTSRTDAPRSPRVLVEKSVNSITTPRKTVPAIEQQGPSPTPAHVRHALGPTPQKDGHVLGLFDLSPGVLASKSGPDEHLAIPATPSSNGNRLDCAGGRSRTPQSSGKRFFLDAFAGTPLKRKREIDDIGTPASVKKTFATPAFLRRASRIDYASNDKTRADRAADRRKRGPVRSLSSIIANLRKNEDERMDDEWQIMEEMEAEEQDDDDHNDDDNDGHDHDGESTSQHNGRTTLHRAQPAQATDQQPPEMPLGPDQPALDSDDEPTADEKAARKPWKKKGLKRQTKKVNMKPVLHQPRKAVDLAGQDVGTASNDDGVASQNGQQSKEDVPGIVKKALRKVNEAAHMNFRRLKIKNKNSKASGRGRFGRR